MTNDHLNDDVNANDAGAAGDTTPEKSANRSGLGDPGHTFDQTNGLVNGLQGDTDGLADENTSDTDEDAS